MRAVVHKSQLETSGAALLSRFPNAACHDGINYVFADTDSGAPHIVVSEVIPEDLTHDQQALFIAKLMAQPNRVEHIWLDNNLCHILFNHPAHRLWCGNYEDELQRQEDWESLAAILDGQPGLAAQWPEYSPSATDEQVKQVILSAL